MATICSYILLIILSWSLVGCSDRLGSDRLSTPQATPQPVLSGKLSEVAPPSIIEELRESLDQYQPQVTILSPQADQVFQDTTINVKLQVRDLPIFKDPDLNLGPHLLLIVDNEPPQVIYDINQPLILDRLTPGSHTLRVFAARPWHESFKNDGAYAQTTFHLFTKTDTNIPNPSQPLLTYSQPQGNYGAEPILLDFYLTNAPLHFVAQKNAEDEISDWRIRVTINGQSFLLDTWQPVYIKGFEKGNNWVQLEFLDEQGNKIDNTFNNTVRLIAYQPNGKDTLSKLIRGELTVAAARAIVDPDYKAKLIPTPTPTPIPTPPEGEIPSATVKPSETLPPVVEETPTVKPETPLEPTVQPQETLPPIVEETPTVEPETSLEPTVQPQETLPPIVEETPTVEPETSLEPSNEPTEILPPVVKVTPTPQPKTPLEKPKWLDSILNRLQRQETTPSPSFVPESKEVPAPEPVKENSFNSSATPVLPEKITIELPETSIQIKPAQKPQPSSESAVIKVSPSESALELEILD